MVRASRDKGSDMVASALMHCFKNVMSDLLNQQHLRLFSDSCFGQNKNMNVQRAKRFTSRQGVW